MIIAPNVRVFKSTHELYFIIFYRSLYEENKKICDVTTLKTTIQKRGRTTFSHYRHEKCFNLIQIHYRSYISQHRVLFYHFLARTSTKFIPIHLENKCFGFWFPASHHLWDYNMLAKEKQSEFLVNISKSFDHHYAAFLPCIMSNMTKKMTRFLLIQSYFYFTLPDYLQLSFTSLK